MKTRRSEKEVVPENKKVDFFFSNLFTTINRFTVIFDSKYHAYVLSHRKLKNDAFLNKPRMVEISTIYFFFFLLQLLEVKSFVLSLVQVKLSNEQ